MLCFTESIQEERQVMFVVQTIDFHLFQSIEIILILKKKKKIIKKIKKIKKKEKKKKKKKKN